jgi:hypothetical protein
MTIPSHIRYSEKNYSGMKEDVKVVGIKEKMHQKAFEEELAEMKARVTMMMRVLEEQGKDQWFGWELKKKTVSWSLL